MRRTVTIASMLFIALMIGLTSVPVRAADTPLEISDTQLEQIKQNCKQAQSVLQRLETTDVVTRVSRGRLYENLLNHLLAPFNSRVSLNRLDASTLTSTTTSITQKFADFKTDYQEYADSLSSLLSIKCESDPRGFYTLLVSTRDSREKVANDITDLNTLLDRYSDAFTALRATIVSKQ